MRVTLTLRCRNFCDESPEDGQAVCDLRRHHEHFGSCESCLSNTSNRVGQRESVSQAKRSWNSGSSWCSGNDSRCLDPMTPLPLSLPELPCGVASSPRRKSSCGIIQGGLDSAAFQGGRAMCRTTASNPLAEHVPGQAKSLCREVCVTQSWSSRMASCRVSTIPKLAGCRHRPDWWLIGVARFPNR